jgi:hypothetical protein
MKITMTDLSSPNAQMSPNPLQGAALSTLKPQEQNPQNNAHQSFMDPVVMRLAEKCLLSPLCGVSRQLPIKSNTENGTNSSGEMTNNAREGGAHPEQNIGPNSAMLSVLTDTRSLPIPAQSEPGVVPTTSISNEKGTGLSNSLAHGEAKQSRQEQPGEYMGDTLANMLAFPSMVGAGLSSYANRSSGHREENGDLYTNPYLQVLSRTDISDPKQRLAYISSVAQNDGAVRDPRKNAKGKKLSTLNELAVTQSMGTHTTYDEQTRLPSITRMPLLPLLSPEEA